jgi:hypothetical protein
MFSINLELILTNLPEIYPPEQNQVFRKAFEKAHWELRNPAGQILNLKSFLEPDRPLRYIAQDYL